MEYLHTNLGPPFGIFNSLLSMIGFGIAMFAIQVKKSNAGVMYVLFIIDKRKVKQDW